MTSSATELTAPIPTSAGIRTPLDCSACPAALTSAAVGGGEATCPGCGAVWGEVAAAEALGGVGDVAGSCCEEARDYLRRLLSSAPREGSLGHGPSSHNACVRCEGCGATVSLSDKGLVRHADRESGVALKAAGRLRRKALLRDLDELARWASESAAAAQEPKPRQGNSGGGAKPEARDRSDRVNDNHDALHRALGHQRKLDALGAAGRQARRRAESFGVSLALTLARPGADVAGLHAEHESLLAAAEGLERACAVLRWLAFECPVAKRQKLPEAVGERFALRPARERQLLALADLNERLHAQPLSEGEAQQERARVYREFASLDDHAAYASALQRLVRASTPAEQAAAQAAVQQASNALATLAASRSRALYAVEERVMLGKRHITRQQYEALVKAVPKVPGAEAVKRAGVELLRLAEEAWLGEQP